jgi:hypothetical protein
VAEGRTDLIVGTASARLTKHFEKRYVFRCIFVPNALFTLFATNSKKRKQRFIERFYSPAGDPKAQLA